MASLGALVAGMAHELEYAASDQQRPPAVSEFTG